MQKRRLTEIKRKRKSIPKYTYLGCPLTKNRTPWCFRICKPSKDGSGACGRIAPHTLRGRIQNGIIQHELEKLRTERESNLEQKDLPSSS